MKHITDSLANMKHKPLLLSISLYFGIVSACFGALMIEPFGLKVLLGAVALLFYATLLLIPYLQLRSRNYPLSAYVKHTVTTLLHSSSDL